LPGAPTYAPSINKISASDANVRLNQYLLTRRVFLNRANPIVSPAGDPLLAEKQAQEDLLYDFVTGDNGRCNMGPIAKQRGFVACYQNCNNPGSGYNLCDDSSIPPAEPLLPPCTDQGQSCTSGTTCCDGATCPSGGGTCPRVPSGPGGSCQTDSDCQPGLSCLDLGGITKVCQ
jgi:hypothetical protein